MDGAFNPCHPGALAHLDPPPLTASVVADLICAGLNNNLLAEELSPSLSRLERSLCAWLAERLGLGEGSGGVAASGGSLSNLMALVVARHQAGLQGRSDAVVFCSADAHVSIGKALAVMGLPPQALHSVPVDAAGALNPLALAEALEAAQAAGQPVISVDTKKKENVGEFKNAGADYRAEGRPDKVNVHDFIDKELGKAIPYGVYDIAANAGYVSVGINHDTAEFAAGRCKRCWMPPTPAAVSR